MSQTNQRIDRLLASIVLLAATLALALCSFAAPAKADSGIDYSNGTYATSGFSVTTGMFGLSTDYPPYFVINGDTTTLVVTTDAANKYDAIWIGKRSNAPADPSTTDVILGIPIYAEDGYTGPTHTDANGKVRAYTFVIPFTTDQLRSVLEDENDIDMYWTLRRATWSPNNPGQWMGTGDHYFTFGTLAKESDSTDVPEAPSSDESAIDTVRELIRALPTDSFDITADLTDAINEAKAAYDALSAADQAQLDTEICANSQSFGRVLEAAVWTVTSFAAVDNSTTLTDGTYSSGITATSDMGKSTSERQRGWTVQKVIVTGGKATARIKWDGNTPLDTLRIGSQSYSNLASDGTSVFEIPVDLNSDLYFAVKIKGATEATDAVAYHLVVSMDEATATPDQESDPSDDGGQGGGNGGNGGNQGGNGGSGNNSGSGGNSSGSGSSSSGKTSSGSGASGTSGASLAKPNGSSSSSSTGSTASTSAVQDPVLNPDFPGAEEDGVLYAEGVAAEEAKTAGFSPFAVLFLLLGALVVGAAGFTGGFVKRGR